MDTAVDLQQKYQNPAYWNLDCIKAVWNTGGIDTVHIYADAESVEGVSRLLPLQ